MISGAAGPEHAAGVWLARAGVDWDAIRVARYVAVRALEHIGDPGAVTVDPHWAHPSLTFFVPAGSAANWRIPQSVPFSWMTHVELPPDDKATPPGAYWLIRPAHGLTQVRVLRQALEAVAGDAGGCDADPQAPCRGDAYLPLLRGGER